jgi:hypothetical protein
MVITEKQLSAAEQRMEVQRAGGHAVRARFDERRSRIVIALSTGVELTFPTSLAEGLAGATPDQLRNIEISPAGLGLHWPLLDADLHVPSLMQGVFGSRQWMARQMGAAGGRARTPAKVAAAQVNGRKGGRPKQAQATG